MDEMELLQSQLDNLYENYKVRRAASEKKYLEELEKRKGLPAQRLREQVKTDGSCERRTSWTSWWKRKRR